MAFVKPADAMAFMTESPCEFKLDAVVVLAPSVARVKEKRRDGYWAAAALAPATRLAMSVAVYCGMRMGLVGWCWVGGRALTRHGGRRGSSENGSENCRRACPRSQRRFDGSRRDGCWRAWPQRQ